MGIKHAMQNEGVLVVVDMQVDFVSGALGSKDAEAIVPNVCEKVKTYKKKGALIIATQDTHEQNYLETHEGKYLPVKHCIKGTSGHEIDERLDEILGDYAVYVEKKGFGSLELVDVIKAYVKENNIAEKDLKIEAIGLCTDICVVSNAILLRSAFPEAMLKVDASCCAGTNEAKHLATLEVLKSCQIDVI